MAKTAKAKTAKAKTAKATTAKVKTAKAKTAKAKKLKAKKAPGKKKDPGKKTAPVPVRISSEGVVLDREVNVKKGQDVCWIAQDGGGPWTITFKNGPFLRNTYTVPRGGRECTTEGAKGPVGKTYRYTVSNGNGQTDEAEVTVE